jgi:uncharacterized membrane protein YqiK
MNFGEEQILGLLPVLAVVGVIAFLLLGVLALLARFYRQVDQGKALVVNTMRTDPWSRSPVRWCIPSSTGPR